jgi:signal transduction histidine kinase
MTGAPDALAAGWPLAGMLALALAALAGRIARRRTAINRALHELRRPLQALALAVPAPQSDLRPASSALRLAIRALGDLERTVNGSGPSSGGAVPFDLRCGPASSWELCAAAAQRWQARARLANATITLDWRAGDGVVRCDRAALAQAFDNLLLNAIEHGGPRITLGGAVRRERLLISVCDTGREAGQPRRAGSPREVLVRLVGTRRRGHGLSVVRATAAEHGGRFVLYRGERGTTAMLELPLLAEDGMRAA